MKKILLFLLPIFILMIGSRALAAPSASDLKSFYDQNYQSLTGVSISQDYWNYFVNNASAYGNYQKVCMGVSYSSSYSQVYIFGGSNFTVSADSFGFTINGTTDAYYWNAANQPYTGIRNTLTNQTLSGGLNSTNLVNEVVVMDFSNVIYDPLIPTPDFDVFYVENSTNATQFFPIVFSLKNNSNPYFIEIYMENLTPSSLGIGPKDVYTPYTFYQFPSHAIYSKQSLTLASEVSNGVLNGLLSAAWRSDILSYDESNVDISPNTAAWTTSNPTYIYFEQAWYMYRNIACFYGNNSSVSMRYFTIRDGQVYGGKVKSWTSLYGGNTFSESIPDYYVPDDPAQGYENETTTDIVPVETSNPSISFPANQTGKKTGLSININLGSNVPNYPDYPTIATYNTDNLLVYFLDTAKQLPDFFTSSIAIFNGMFDGLFPDPFWGIIMTGFLFSIVIMIIKVL